jgi:four helix bundle protein
MQDFHRLKVWEKAHSLAIDVHRVTGTFSRQEGVALVGQLRRAALSIPANIAEGAAKPGNVEFRRFLHIAMGSAAETDYHLLVARDLGFLELPAYQDLSGRATEVRRMLGGLIKKVTAATDSPAAPPPVQSPPVVPFQPSRVEP